VLYQLNCLINLSRLLFIYIISFIIILYLIVVITIQIFDVTVHKLKSKGRDSKLLWTWRYFYRGI
jgi:hypothetical protein